MREIKFRVWDNVNKVMINTPHIIFPDNDGFFWRQFPNDKVRSDVEANLMQYTGRKNKDAKEIYEGDLFGKLGGDMTKSNEYEIHGEVYFDNDLLAFCVELRNGGWEYLNKYLAEQPREIIGNIYENPELLTN
jgi:uncharacterized phage protein (TIGR01671 family)